MMVGMERKWSKKYQPNLQPKMTVAICHLLTKRHITKSKAQATPIEIFAWLLYWVVGMLLVLWRNCVCLFCSLFFGWGSERPGFVSIRVMLRFKICPR
jgi:hypothetical protein